MLTFLGMRAGLQVTLVTCIVVGAAAAPVFRSESTGPTALWPLEGAREGSLEFRGIYTMWGVGETGRT